MKAFRRPCCSVVTFYRDTKTNHEETMKSGSPLVSYGLVFTNAQNHLRRRPGNEDIGTRCKQVQECGMRVRVGEW